MKRRTPAPSSVSVHSVRETSTSESLPNATVFLSKAMVSPALLPDRIVLGMEVLAVGSRIDSSGEVLDPDAVVNANVLTRDLVEGLQASITV